MIGVDTNVLVRYFMRDDPSQSASAIAFIDSLARGNKGFVSLVVVVELVWVLNYVFRLKRMEVRTVLGKLMTMRVLKVERNIQCLCALRMFNVSAADFADCLIVCVAKQAGCSQLVTFDRKAAKLPGAIYIG
nr:PIN domain-containing protein [uncultured Duganella sp.]